MKKIIIPIIVLIIFSAAFALADNGATMVDRGNSSYHKQKYDDALRLYNEAQIKSPEQAEIYFNIGDAQYKKEEYLLAIGSFEKATLAKDKMLEAKANFNIGNAKYKLGILKKNTDLNASIKLFREALDYYKRTLELNPKDIEAKLNHELVEKELKELLDQQKNQQKEQQQKGQQQEQKDQQQEDKAKDQQSGSQQKEQQANAGEQAKQEEQKQQEEAQAQAAKESQEKENKEEQAAGQEQEKTKKENQAKAGEAGQAQEMTKEEAKMLLDSFRQEENARGKLDDTRKGSTQDAAENW